MPTTRLWESVSKSTLWVIPIRHQTISLGLAGANCKAVTYGLARDCNLVQL